MLVPLMFALGTIRVLVLVLVPALTSAPTPALCEQRCALALRESGL
jgi:hypothetical protein